MSLTCLGIQNMILEQVLFSKAEVRFGSEPPQEPALFSPPALITLFEAFMAQSKHIVFLTRPNKRGDRKSDIQEVAFLK